MKLYDLQQEAFQLGLKRFKVGHSMMIEGLQKSYQDQGFPVNMRSRSARLATPADIHPDLNDAYLTTSRQTFAAAIMLEFRQLKRDLGENDDAVEMDGRGYKPFVAVIAKAVSEMPLTERVDSIDGIVLSLTGSNLKAWQRRINEARRQLGPFGFPEVFPGQSPLNYLRGIFSNPEIGYKVNAQTWNVISRL